MRETPLLIVSSVLVALTFGCARKAESTSERASAKSAVVPRAPEIRAPRNAPSSSAVAPPWPLKLPPKVQTDWCTKDTLPLDEETCFVLPEQPTRELIIYLHGVVPPTPESSQKSNLQRVLANACRRAGVAALLPRGLQGYSKSHRGFWTWPNAPSAYRDQVPALRARFLKNKAQLESISGVKFEKVYVAGSSAGAYFSASLALRGDFEADGFAVLSGGGGHSTPELPRLKPKPVYIGYGTEDRRRTVEEVLALAPVFKNAGWPVKLAGHSLGHGSHEIYLDEAFAFFRR
jgi:predicted esterase